MRNVPLICVLLAACATPRSNPAPVHSLDPYLTSTSSPTSTPDVVLLAETALPTNTPQTYVVQAGDTLSELAETFRVSLDDLRAANPDIDPNSMTIGMSILIPAHSSALAAASTPTPVPAPITQADCYPTTDDGLWCFALIQNNTPDLLENVAAQISLIDQNGDAVASQPAISPLDILPPGTSLPAYVFFPNAPANVHPRVQLISALQLKNSDARYLPAVLNDTLAQISGNGRSAQLGGQISLPAESQAAKQVWVAAVAYDKDGRVVGVKRWEGGAIQPGTSISFNFGIASAGSRIESVEFAVEARP